MSSKATLTILESSILKNGPASKPTWVAAVKEEREEEDTAMGRGPDGTRRSVSDPHLVVVYGLPFLTTRWAGAVSFLAYVLPEKIL
jgi:hypothetical protein